MASRHAATDKLLHEKGAGKKCKTHKRPVKLGVLWADGRAIAFFCGRECFLDWEEGQGEWACVVRVIAVNA